MTKDKLIGRASYNPLRGRMCLVFAIILGLFLFLSVLLSGKYKYVTVEHIKALNPLRQRLDLEYVQENLEDLDQMDPRLIEFTRFRFLTPPSKLPYSFKYPDKNTKDQFSGWVANFFQNKRGGIFIEAGANEGERGSHTLYLEKELGWTGLLIECNPTVVPYLKSHHRKAWVGDVCLTPSRNPGTVNFSNPTNWTYSGTFKKPWNLPVPTTWTFFDVQTLPLYAVLAAVGYTEVDYFSFDIEGLELGVLKTIPFDLITFRVLIIEIYFYTTEEKRELDDLLISNGYIFVRKMDIDFIYVHNSVQHLLPAENLT